MNILMSMKAIFVTAPAAVVVVAAQRMMAEQRARSLRDEPVASGSI